MLLATAMVAFMGQNTTYNKQDAIAEIQQNLRGVNALLESEIRMAGYDPAERGAGFTAATQNNLSFRYWKDTDGDGDFRDEASPEIIDYRLDGAANELIKERNGDGGTVLAANIEQLRFEYLFWNSLKAGGPDWEWANDATVIEAALGVSPAKSMDFIRAVKIVVLGSERDSAFRGTDTATYRPPLEGAGAGTTWTPVVGTGYKRMASVLVQCRNNRG
jgi:hypothetical protein